MNRYNKKHILFVSTMPPARGCGPPVISYRHLSRLKDWKITILVDSRAMRRVPDLPESWRTIVIPRFCFTLLFSKDRFAKWLSRRLDGRPSVILNGFGTNSILAYHLSKTWNVPLSVMLHDPWEIWVKAWSERHCMRTGGADMILNHTSRVWSNARELADIYNIRNKEKIKILHPIPEENNADFVKWKDSFGTNPVVAFAGSFRLHEVRIFRALARSLRKINGTLLLITTNNNVVKVLLGNLPNVRFRKPSDNASVIRYIKERASSVLVPLCFDLEKHQWRKVGFPAKLTEFTHLGLPVIIMTPEGTPLSNWAKEHKWSGYLNTLDSKRILELLKEIRNKESWIKMAEQSKRAALNEFNPDTIQAQFESELIV